MRVELLEDASPATAPTIVCAQAGEVNTGAFDDLETVVDRRARSRRLGARRRRLRPLGGGEPAASPTSSRGPCRRRLVGDRRPQVAERPVRLRHRDLRPSRDARGRDGVRGAVPRRRDSDAERDPMGYSPEFSRRARSLPAWAAIRSLGRRGVAEMVEGSCAHARAIAEGLAALPGLRDPQRRRPQPGRSSASRATSGRGVAAAAGRAG